MRLVLSIGEVVFCVCVIAIALYISPLFIDEVNANASNAWEFLLTWDDRENFVTNEVIQSGLSLTNLYTMFTMTKINVYEPFGWVLKAVEVQCFGLDSWRIRLMTTALHFVAAVVLAGVSSVLLDVIAMLSDVKEGVTIDGERRQLRGRRHWYGCCISAMVFAIHPVHVEVVMWPSAQPYTLCVLFSNLAMYVYIQAMYQELYRMSISKKNAKAVLMSSIFSGHGRSDLVCCGLYATALLSKSVCILLPLSFFLVDVLVYASLQPYLPRPSAKQLWAYAMGKVPVAITLLTFLAVMLESNYEGMHPDADVLSLTRGERVIKATTMPAWVLRRILWPVKLRPHYQLRPEELSLTNPDCLLSLSASMALVLFTLRLFMHRYAPQHLLALAYFSVMVLPVSGLIQHGMVSAGCDRYAYLCSIVVVPYGGSALARWLFGGEENEGKVIGMEDEASKSVKTHLQPKPEYPRSVVVGSICVLAGILLSISTNSMGPWRNDDALLEYSLRMDPTDWRILDQRSIYFLDRGVCSCDQDMCRGLWELAYHFTPVGTLKSELQRLRLLVQLGQVDRACETYTKLLELRPDNCHLHNNVAVCLAAQRDLQGARREFTKALQTPGYEYVYDTPRKNLKAFDEWSLLLEAARARGEEDSVPALTTKIMY